MSKLTINHLALFVEREGKRRKRRYLRRSQSMSGEVGDSTSEMAHFVKKMTRRTKHFYKKNVKNMLWNPKNSKYKGITKLKSSVMCFECDRKKSLQQGASKIEQARGEAKKRRRLSLKKPTMTHPFSP